MKPRKTRIKKVERRVLPSKNQSLEWIQKALGTIAVKELQAIIPTASGSARAQSGLRQEARALPLAVGKNHI
jgi:hypothetical protein